tara:strand:- start:1075 stop:1191 length:117 start_codon:yes stop_codon:yes gene_type:complete
VIVFLRDEKPSINEGFSWMRRERDKEEDISFLTLHYIH